MTASKYVRRPIPFADNDPCNECPVFAAGRCKNRFSPYRYDEENLVTDLTDPVDLLVIGGPPTPADAKRGMYMSGRSGNEIMDGIESLGIQSFIIAPALRCYVGKVDYSVLDRKFREERAGQYGHSLVELPIDAANGAMAHCKDYVNRLDISIKRDLTLVMGPLAVRSMGMKGSIQGLRSKGLIPKSGMKIMSKAKGTLVTWDRSAARYSTWAGLSMLDAIDYCLPSILENGRISPYGNRDDIDIAVLDTVEKVKNFVDLVLNDDPCADVVPEGDLLCFDFETTSLAFDKDQNQIINVGMSFASNPDRSFVIPYAHPETPFSPDDLADVKEHLTRLFRGVGARFDGYVAHNAQFEVGIVKSQFGVWLGEDGGKAVLDTMILAYLLDENRRGSGIAKPYSLETLAREFLGFDWYEKSGMKSKRAALIDQPLDDVNEYVGVDAAVTSRLYRSLCEHMEVEESLEDLMRVAKKLYSEAIKYTVDMQINGQKIDLDLLMMLRAKDSSIYSRLEEIRQEFADSPAVKRAIKILNKKKGGQSKGIFKTSSSNGVTEIDLNSQLHRRTLFWNVLKLSGADESVDKSFQERHKGSEPLVALFQEYQKLSKLDSAYLGPMAEWLQKSGDGRLHPSFNLTQSTSGRLSASKPNTQQIPRGDTRDKKQIKSLYTVKDGCIMVQLDFSQAEVRWLGILSGDENLAERYRKAEELESALKADPTNKDLQRLVKIDGDLHMSTAIDMYGIDPDTVVSPEGDHTDEAKLKRQAAKAVCFGLIYGKHYKSLARDLGISEDEAEAAVEKWLGQFPAAAEWLERVDAEVVVSHMSKSPFGRWRRLPGAASTDTSIANRAKRQARNTPIQSAASDFCIYAACKLRRALQNHEDPEIRKIKLINTVHDSLAAEVPADVDTVLEYMRVSSGIFTDPALIEEDFGVTATVPLKVDFDIGANWGNVEGASQDRDDIERILRNAAVLREQPVGTLLKDLKGTGLIS